MSRELQWTLLSCPTIERSNGAVFDSVIFPLLSGGTSAGKWALWDLNRTRMNSHVQFIQLDVAIGEEAIPRELVVILQQ